jgi:transposase
MPTLTYREAAKLTGRAVNTIRHWRRSGMVMGWEERNGQQVRVVELHVLQAYFRERLGNWPTHRYRMRALRAARASAQDATRRVPQPPPP